MPVECLLMLGFSAVLPGQPAGRHRRHHGSHLDPTPPGMQSLRLAAARHLTFAQAYVPRTIPKFAGTPLTALDPDDLRYLLRHARRDRLLTAAVER